jgi:hypothetical protein
MNKKGEDMPMSSLGRAMLFVALVILGLLIIGGVYLALKGAAASLPSPTGGMRAP